MKKINRIIPFVFVPIFVTSCNTSKIDIPNSPFSDSYTRIGAESEFKNIKINSLTDDEYYNLQQTLTNYDKDTELRKYTVQDESRDLKYAYFGKQDLTMSMCSLTSDFGTFSRYDNDVNFTDRNTKQLRQTSGGILTNNLLLNEYVVDNGSEPATYYETTASKKNDESLVVKKTDPIEYEKEEKEKVFSLTSYAKIKRHFTLPEFTLLGKHAVYGKFNYDNKELYIIKEGHSVFSPYSTAVGHKYKAVDNYFYEAVLEKEKKGLYFRSFRFYTEKLILSQSCESEGVPVIYLEKPVLVTFSETSYKNFEYSSIGNFDKSKIPEPTI